MNTHGLWLILATVLCFTPTLQAQQRPSPGPAFVMLLGVAQDGGYPQAGCRKLCCKQIHESPERHRHVASLAIIDPASQERWLIDATPDFPAQIAMAHRAIRHPKNRRISGIFLTHAHIGHYAGLIHLGREVMGAIKMPVFAMPRMKSFLENNGPWSQLVSLKNIHIHALQAHKAVKLNHRITVTPVVVPHRDEFSETVGYMIKGTTKSVFWLPDIDKWERFKVPIESIIRSVDVAYLDGTFFAADELPGRDMAEIPHPFIIESIKRFRGLPESERKKIRFIHLNHSNPALQQGSKAWQLIHDAGHAVGEQREVFEL